MRCHYREYRYFCGEYLSTEHCAIFRKPGQRKKKAKPTSEIQKKLNERRAINTYIRTVHANFGPDDLSVGLDYRPGDMPQGKEEADNRLRNFLKRLRGWYRRNGITLKYMLVTELSRRGRIHHHFILSGMGEGVDDRRVLRELWGHGRVNSDLLQFDESGIKGLAIYIASDEMKRSDPQKGGHRLCKKRWSGSRNLIKPLPQEHNGRLSNREIVDLCTAIEEKRDISVVTMREYPGYELVEVWPEKNPFTGTWHLEMWLVKKTFKDQLNGTKKRSRLGAAIPKLLGACAPSIS